MSDIPDLLDCVFGVRFWGVRGSIPVSGADYACFGGDTSCFEVVVGSQRFLIDGGSGLRRCGDALAAAGLCDATLLFTHLHLDHVIGLTSFRPLLSGAGTIAMHAPDTSGDDLRGALDSLFREPFFPIGLDQVAARVCCTTFAAGQTLTIADQTIPTVALRHGAGAAGYRFDHAGQAIVILMDYEHVEQKPEPELVTFCQGADLIVYDAMWDEAVDFDRHRGWGHSSWQAGLRLLEAAGAGRLACVHHAPSHRDHELADRENRMRLEHPDSVFARQDSCIVLRGQPDAQSPPNATVRTA